MGVEKDKTGDTTDDPRTFFKNILPNRLRKDEDKKKKGDKVILTESVSDATTEILETDVTAEEAEEANPEDELEFVTTFDPAEGYKYFDPEQTEENGRDKFNTITKMDPDKAYWVKM